MTNKDFDFIYRFIGVLQYGYEGQAQSSLNRCNTEHYIAKAEELVCFRIMGFLQEKFPRQYEAFLAYDE